MAIKSSIPTSNRDLATSYFSQLQTQFGAPSNVFWRTGNAFDTLIDCLDVLVDCRSQANAVGQAAIQQYNSTLKSLGGLNAAWFDDFGWWIAPIQRALNRDYFSAANKQQLKEIVDQCWSQFNDNAPYVFERRTAATYNDYGPKKTGGVWNEYWTGTDPKWNGPKTGDPTCEEHDLWGIQNTVTNALYLMAAQRLGVSTVAKSAFDFLFGWLQVTDNNTSLLWKLNEQAKLVRERVGALAGEKPAPRFQQDWAWTGDQGLVIADLCDAAQLYPDLGDTLILTAQVILAGVAQRLTNNNVLQHYIRTSGFVPDNDTDDYDTGTGVFWRNVLYVFNQNAQLAGFIKSKFVPILQASADDVPQAADPLVRLTNQASVLVTATAILGE